MIALTEKTWSPYLAGALTGITLILSVLISGKFFGASTTYVVASGMIENIISPDHVAGLAYFQKYSLGINWQWMFVLGVMIGSFVSSKASQTFSAQALPPMWQERFGDSVRKRALAAFAGGILVIYGARLAGGCPSGHGLSGFVQMSISGYISLIFFFAGGAVVARIIYRKG